MSPLCSSHLAGLAFAGSLALHQNLALKLDGSVVEANACQAENSQTSGGEGPENVE
jgi:hypothetical protein